MTVVIGNPLVSRLNLTADAVHIFEHGAAELRAAMARVLNRLGIPPQPPHLSAMHAALTALSYVDNGIRTILALVPSMIVVSNSRTRRSTRSVNDEERTAAEFDAAMAGRCMAGGIIAEALLINLVIKSKKFSHH